MQREREGYYSIPNFSFGPSVGSAYYLVINP